MLTIVHAVGVKNKILTGNVGVNTQGLEGWSSLSVRRWVGTTGVGGLVDWWTWWQEIEVL